MKKGTETVIDFKDLSPEQQAKLKSTLAVAQLTMGPMLLAGCGIFVLTFLGMFLGVLNLAHHLYKVWF